LPALPTLQDADETNASTPMPTGEDEDEEDRVGLSSHAPSQSYMDHEKPSVAATTSHPVTKPTITRPEVLRHRADLMEDDDTDSGRLVFTPSLETPVETQANTPQDFESMSPAPVELDELKREAQVELVVKGLDEGQAEMEEEMEEDVVVKEKEHSHSVNEEATTTLDPSVATEDSESMDIDSNL
jgi:hypothetical protein